MFGSRLDDGDQQSGTIHVARSVSDDPFIAEHRDLVHNIGVTGGDPKARIAGAMKDPTFLMAEAELVATYKLANINRKGLQSTLHKSFAPARLDVGLADRFGETVKPREWFLVPVEAIAEAVDRLIDGTLPQYS